jgi:tRNA-dihydrouridine synthase
LTGKNLVDVEKAIKNPEVLTKVKDTLENEEKLNALIDNLVGKGMKDAKDTLIKHADRLVDRYNQAAVEAGLDSKLDFIAKGNITELNGET